MEDDIDYGELFGVTPEDGQDQEPGPSEGGRESQLEEGAGAQQEGQGPALEAAGAAPEEQGAEVVPNSGTTQQTEGSPDSLQQKPEADPIQSGASPEPNKSGNAPAAGAGEVQALPPEEAAKKAIDEAFALSGLKNPYTGQPITSKAEYDAYREQFARERRAEVLKRTGMTEEEFSRFIQDTPEVREARRAREEMERAVREAREAAAKVKVDEQLREISALDPSVKSLEDLAKMPTYPRFYELVRRGNTLTDAFRLANFDALAQRSAAGARQAAVNSARSKEHLAETRTRGSGGVSVPAEVREQYLLLNPGITEEEIQKHYQRYHKEGIK